MSWLVTLFALAVISCGPDPRGKAQEPQPSKTPPLQLSPSAREKLIAGVHKVSLGMSASEVLKVLGRPTYDDVVGPKKNTQNNSEFRREFRYVLSGDGGNTNDETIGIEFDSHGERVLSIWVVNLPEFKDDRFKCSKIGPAWICVTPPNRIKVSSAI